jgi:hypothetical protein
MRYKLYYITYITIIAIKYIISQSLRASMQQKLHEQVVKLRKIYEGLRLAILEIIRAVCAKTAEPPPQKSGSRHTNP